MPRLIKKAAAARKLDWHPEHLMRKARQNPDFPQPFKLSDELNAAVFFDEVEIDEFVAKRMAERRVPSPPAEAAMEKRLAAVA
jgi:predicted DNA-binding transcriptional regulator AlpA